MANLLKRAIYHEKQESGSMLCAQHALNALLQQPLFTAFDLAAIAQKLDAMEQVYDTNNKGKSTNMDDSGFFSVQVLEDALQVWGLTLVRWRSEEMKRYQNRPHTQLAFILNLDEHWFTLRRFGPAEPDLSKDPGNGHWFNLNSCIQEPEWVSRTYLGMVLQQAETEGYSVFAVTQMDPLGELGLARTKADELAAGIPELTDASTRISTSRMAVTGGPSTSSKPDWNPEGLEDEDMELQAALLASVMGETPEPAVTQPSRPPLSETPSEKWEIRNARPAFSHPSSGIGSTPLTDDSLEVSARRAREELARFQEEQMQALAQGVDSDDAISNLLAAHPDAATVSSPPRRRAPRPRRDDEEEEEMMRRAIEASTREAQERGRTEEEEPEHDISFDDDDMDLDNDEEEQAQLARLMKQRQEQRREQEELDMIRRATHSTQEWFTSPGETDVPEIPELFRDDILGQNVAQLDDRTYDDEDAQLQAALKASLEGSADISIPPPPKPASRAPTVDSSTAGTSTAPAKPKVVVAEASEEEEDEEESEESEEEEEPAAPPVKLTAEEMRKARLARFGG